MIVELNLFLATTTQGERPATTAPVEGEDGNEGKFSSLFEDSLITEQTPQLNEEDSASPDVEAEREITTDDFSAQPVMVSMGEIINNLGLTEKQISRLAELIGISVDDLGRMEITAKNPDKDFSALMPDGTSRNLAELLNLVKNGQLLNKQEAASRIADMLGISKTASSALLEKLGIFSFEISSETDQPKATTGQTVQQGETATTAQGKVDNSLHQSGQSSNQNANNNNNASGETKAVSINETNGDFTKNADSGFKTALNQATQTVHGENAPEKTAATVAEGDGLKAPVASASKAFQPFVIPPGDVEEANVGKQAKAVMSQIVEKASIISFPNRTRARISLSPPSLGFVNIEISMRKEGASTLLVVVESHAVKQMMEQNIHQLKTTFEQQGIKVEEINVSVAEQGGNSSGSDAREAQSAFSDHASSGGEAKEENPEYDALENERMRKKAGYVLDIKV